MRFRSVVIDSLAHVAPPNVCSSADLEKRLAPLYERLKLPEGRLELMTGIRERRFWDPGTRPSDASARAGRIALERSGLSASQMEVCIHSSVCRDMLEPATAAFVHRLLGLPESVQLYDVSNACLGFLNALAILAAMIDSGQAQAGIVVSGEDGGPLVDHTVRFLNEGSMSRKEIKPYFANLTIGAGAVAAVVCHESLSPEGHRLIGGVVKADTSNNALCQGGGAADGPGLDMRTDSEEMLRAGVALAEKTWDAFQSETGLNANAIDKVVCHQVGIAHQRLLLERLGIDPRKDYATFQTYGNTGSAALPITLSEAAMNGHIQKGDTIGMLGIGSGLNCMMMAARW